MKDLDKITDIQPQINFVEETLYGKDDLKLDRFALKVYDLSTKFSKAMWRYKAKTNPVPSILLTEQPSISADDENNTERPLENYVYYLHKYKSDVEDFYSVNFMRLLQFFQSYLDEPTC